MGYIKGFKGVLSGFGRAFEGDSVFPPEYRILSAVSRIQGLKSGY